MGGLFLVFQKVTRKPSPKYETARVERGRLTARVTSTGTVSALVTVQVGSQVSGRIKEIRVDFNSPVKKSQLIAKIDSALFEASVEQARANLVASRGNLVKAKVQAEDARRQLERARGLKARDLISQAELDTAQANADAAAAQIEVARGAVEQSRAALHQAEVNLAYTDILSPINGVVISRAIDVGQTVAASLQSPTLFTIAEDLRKMQVDSSVAEADVGKLQPNILATFTVDAYPTERFSGRIRQIRNAPQTIQNVVTYDAVIDVDNADLKLRPGMTANVTIIYAERDDALKVPNAALRFRPPPNVINEPRMARQNREGGPSVRKRDMMSAMAAEPGANPAQTGGDRRTVWVLRDDKPERVLVRVGVTDGTVSEVTEGDLHEGELVITDLIGEAAKTAPSSGPPGGAFRNRMF